MSNYTICWYNEEQTIILIDVVNVWNWEDAHLAIKQQVEMAASVEHPVHTIFHFHDIPTVPRGFGLPHIANLMKMRAPNEELAVFVGTHTLLQMLINAISNVYQKSAVKPRPSGLEIYGVPCMLVHLCYTSPQYDQTQNGRS